MPVETATYINDLNAANPASSDGLSQGDDHLRLIKAVLKATFPNLTGSMDLSDAQVDNIAANLVEFADGTSTAPKLRAVSETSLGFYRPATGKLSLTTGKRLLGNGTVAVGSIHQFPKVPSNFSSAGVAGTNTEYLECDGSVYNVADFPDLGAFLGSTFGGNGTTTFGVPSLKDTGRFLRSRTSLVAVGTSQSNVIKNHVHTFTGTAASNTTGVTATTNTTGAHQHTYGLAAGGASTQAGAGGRYLAEPVALDDLTSSNGDHSHTVTVTDPGHTHTVSGTTDNNTGGSADETRPEAFVVIMAIKT
jgi:microcystin-dependent protein